MCIIAVVSETLLEVYIKTEHRQETWIVRISWTQAARKVISLNKPVIFFFFLRRRNIWFWYDATAHLIDTANLLKTENLSLKTTGLHLVPLHGWGSSTWIRACISVWAFVCVQRESIGSKHSECVWMPLQQYNMYGQNTYNTVIKGSKVFILYKYICNCEEYGEEACRTRIKGIIIHSN